VQAWCRTLADAVRARDARPLATGDGMMTSFPTRVIAPLVDWVGPHVYYGDADPLRQAFATDFALRAAEGYGRPVVLEEIGCSSSQAGEREQAMHLREALFAALGTGARGIFFWCFSDFDPETIGREIPYSHHAFELGFGLVRKDGSEKPVCDDLRAARALLDGLPIGEAAPVRPRAALILPRWLRDDIPFSWQDASLLRRTLLQGFVLASQAGLDPALVHEGDDLSAYGLILLPSVQKLETPTWLTLRDAAHAGAAIYWSWFGGDHEFHQGHWCPVFEELTGLTHRLRYGCFDLPADRFVLKTPVPLSIPTGVQHHPAPHSLAWLPVDARSDGPALFEHELGRGRVIFLNAPLERYLAALPDGSSRDAHRLYRLIAEQAGLAPRYDTHHPDVQSRVLTSGADDLVIVQHRGWTASVDDATEVPRDADLLFARGLGKTGSAFGPKGVRVYRVRNVR
jgi:hypothetical protein